MQFKTIIILCALAAVSLVPSAASARGGHGGGGGFHGGGFGGGFGFWPYGYPYAYPYGYDEGFYGDVGVCYVVHQRVHTRHGWRIRRVSICE